MLQQRAARGALKQQHSLLPFFSITQSCVPSKCQSLAKQANKKLFPSSRSHLVSPERPAEQRHEVHPAFPHPGLCSLNSLNSTPERLNCVGSGAVYCRQLRLREMQKSPWLLLWLAGSKHPYRRVAQWQRNGDLHTTAKKLGRKKTSWERKSPSTQESSLQAALSAV